jgi:flagellar basal-body rod protein FlgB
MKTLFAEHIHLVSQVMDLQAKRQNVVAGNLANIDNPHYKARRFHFEEDLQRALELDASGQMNRTDKKHLPETFDARSAAGRLGKELEIRVVEGEDSVDLDQEMAIQAKNAMRYKILAKVLQKGFSGLSDTISKAGR